MKKFQFSELSIFFAFILTVFFCRMTCAASFANFLEQSTRSTFSELMSQSQRINNANNWTYRIEPFVWFSGMNGSTHVQDNAIKINFTPSDSLDASSDVDFIGEINMEMRLGDFTLLFDPTYLRFTHAVNFSPLGATATPTLTLVDFGAFYNLIDYPISHDHRQRIAFQLLGGGRYFQMEMTLNPKQMTELNARDSFLSPFIGARIITPLTMRSNLRLRADYGGFSVDEVKNTWNVSLIADYIINQYITIAAGVRGLGLDFSRGTGVNRFAMNTRLYGPMIGFVFLS